MQQFIGGLKQNWKESTLEMRVLIPGWGPSFSSVNPDLIPVKMQIDLTTLKSWGAGKSCVKEFSISGKQAVVMGGGGDRERGFKLLFTVAKGQNSGDPKANTRAETRMCTHPAAQAAVNISGSNSC